MKILIDMNISPSWVKFFHSRGFAACHWIDIGPPNAPDVEIMAWARTNGHIVFTHDLDFSALLFSTNATSPSVIQLRTQDIRPDVTGQFIISAIKDSTIAITNGALVTIDPEKSRIRLLPLGRGNV